MKKLLNVLKYVLLLGISVLLLWLAFRGQDFNELRHNIKVARYEWVVASMLLSLLAHWSRAYRWRLLLWPLGHRPRTSSAFIALMVGYLANLALPRLGEVLRCTVLNRLDKTPVDACIGTVVAERVLDLVMLVLLLMLALLLEFNRLSGFVFGLFSDRAAAEPSSSSHLLLWLGAGTLAFCLLVLWLVRRYQHLLNKNVLYLRLKTFLSGVVKGLLTVRHLDHPWQVLFHTFFIWFVYYLMTYVVFFALPETSHLGPVAGLSILMIGGLGMAAPVQGGIGAYHYLVSKGLVLYGISEVTGLSLATIGHGSQTLLVLIAGGLCLLWSVLRLRHQTKMLVMHEQRS